ncbi:hypothetical protein [Paenibacillus pinihumi]|uniref:hypothetical protein n=1 Tax=Paenibacillus pinihumi TaxID=669462 RepID=UPI000428FBC3|nr:hypothetical protein [Paenibacillus pinihumi]
MDFEEALIHELKTVSAFDNRIYPLSSPEANAGNGVPYLIFVSSEGEQAKSLGEGHLSSKEVPGEINIIASTYEEMKLLTKQVIPLLTGMEQRVIGVDGPYIQEFTYKKPVELYENQPGLYRCHIEFNTFFGE